MNLEMSEPEILGLLAEPVVGVLSVSAPDLAAPLTTPLWFATIGDELVATTARQSPKVRWLRRAGQATLLVHTDVPRHVAIAVDVEIAEPDDDVRRTIAARYLPAEMLDGYLAQTADADVVLVRMQPTQWRSADLAKAAIQ